jgi:signal transduction histidine kinase
MRKTLQEELTELRSACRHLFDEIVRVTRLEEFVGWLNRKLSR